MTDITEKLAALEAAMADGRRCNEADITALIDHIRALEQERNAAQAKIEALYFAWLAVDDCEEGSVEMDTAVGAMYCAFDETHSGPDGFRTWKDAAVAERVQRVAAQAELARLREQEPVAETDRRVTGGVRWTVRGAEWNRRTPDGAKLYAEPKPAKEK